MSVRSMSLSFKRLRARISLVCASVSFFIGSPFWRSRFSGRDDADHFLAVFFPVGVRNHDGNRTTDHSEGLPSLLTSTTRSRLLVARESSKARLAVSKLI